MAANELDSFVFKLKNLWRNGQEATLNVKTKAGEAWVELQVGLGRPLDLPPPHLQLNQGVQMANPGIAAELSVLLNVRI